MAFPDLLLRLIFSNQKGSAVKRDRNVISGYVTMSNESNYLLLCGKERKTFPLTHTVPSRQRAYNVKLAVGAPKSSCQFTGNRGK